MKTLLDIVNEAKIDIEYNKNWSMIDRDIFNKIALADPKTVEDNEGIKTLGFVAKQLLLPKYVAGETQFVDNIDKIKDAITKYEANPGQYVKLPAFKSVSDFIAYMDNPESITIEEPVKEVDPITKIYNEYYNDIKREDFDKIIAMDPNTTQTNIGEIAKNLLLVSHRKDQNVVGRTAEIKQACKDYYKLKDSLPTEQQQLSAYKSVDDFIAYILNGPESNLVTALKNNDTIDSTTGRMVKDDFRLVGSTFEYDILEPKSHRAAVAISGGYRSVNGMNWCTGAEDSNGYWSNYTTGGGRLFCFMHKTRYRGTSNRDVNWQIQIRDNELREFLNGSDESDYPGATKSERFKNFLLAHKDIFRAIKTKEPFTTLPIIEEVNAEIKYSEEPFIVDSITAAATLEASSISKVCEEVIFSIESIPVAICASFISLKTITFKEGVKNIGDQAFMNCPLLKTLTFPESLEIIGKEAFQNCLELKGSIRIPDNVKEIQTRAFSRNSCKLKINKDRKEKLKFDVIDKEWVLSHVQTITFDK